MSGYGYPKQISHFMHRTVENGVLALCEELGISRTLQSAEQGFLGGMINEYTLFDATNDNRQETLPRSNLKPFVPTPVSWRC